MTGPGVRRPPAALSAAPFALSALTAADWPVEVALSAIPDVVAWAYVPPGLDEARGRARVQRQLSGPPRG